MFWFQSVLKVVVPDELHGSILTKTLPAKPHMTTKDVCNIIAHKARITNPQDYALYRVTDGEGVYSHFFILKHVEVGFITRVQVYKMSKKTLRCQN